jgi:hypothetical protein
LFVDLIVLEFLEVFSGCTGKELCSRRKGIDMVNLIDEGLIENDRCLNTSICTGLHNYPSNHMYIFTSKITDYDISVKTTKLGKENPL